MTKHPKRTAWSKKQALENLFTLAKSVKDPDGLVRYASNIEKQLALHADKQNSVMQVLHLLNLAFMAMAAWTKAASLDATLTSLDLIDRDICHYDMLIAINVLESSVANFANVPRLRDKVASYLKSSEARTSDLMKSDRNTVTMGRLYNHKARHGGFLLLMAMVNEWEATQAMYAQDDGQA